MSDSDDKKNEIKVVGLDLVASQEQAIANITEVEPEYMQYFDNLAPEKQKKIVNSINRIQTGLHAVAPIMCLGPNKCPFIDRCPIPERDSNNKLEYGPDANYPMGRECILEKFYMQQKLVEYVSHLNVDPGNPVEMSIVNELALIDLYKNRTLMIMAVGDKAGQGRDFMRVDVLGFSESGDKAEQAKLHPAVDMLDRLERRREKWLEKLMETRKSKADWMVKVGGGGNESKILSEITKLREALSQLEGVEAPQLIEEDDDDEILID
tara:strand:- start:1577 stop:2374 length:798 start_codon:yes stop_codon:yes gene_type:complete